MPRSNLADAFQPGQKLTFGCHDFLNSKPILYPLLQGVIPAPFDMVLDSPARLADRLKEGELDLAFIPAVEYARINRLRIVPGFSIAATGEVKTVLLYSRKNLEEIKTVAVDQRSRTSVSLLKVLMHGFYKQKVSFNISAGGDPLAVADAALVIGDEAFKIHRKKFHVYDLSEEWFKFTGKPFVFSILCAAPGVEADVAVEALRRARGAGRILLDDIVASGAELAGISQAQCHDYLRNRIQYDLTPAHVEGLKLFLELAFQYGVTPANPPLVFY
ncbi:MAG: menaquinone biosynthesis protein [Nitrospinae bacterium]|nr:menaquinone biosynthesis protein [Nitrospinota bacterium]